MSQPVDLTPEELGTMKSIDRFTGKRRDITEPRSETSLGVRAAKLLDRASLEVMTQCWEVLVKRPLVYVVPAVWGTGVGSSMDRLQKEMNKGIAPVLEEVMKSLDLQDLTLDQEFAIQYFLRGYIVTKLLFMIEVLRGRPNRPEGGEEPEETMLAFLQPVGIA